MKQVRFSKDAARFLAHHEARDRLRRALRVYAETGQGDVRPVRSEPGILRLRAGDWRILFAETDEELTVLRIGPRGSIYDD